MNPLSLLATGGKKIGGLFQAMGQNFDRNAAGPLPEILGAEYTPAMKSRARVNAIMGIGAALSGQAPLQQSLAHGQQGILGGWQAGQDLKRQKEQRTALAQLGQEMLDSPSAANDAEALFSQAQKYDRIAARHMMGGNEKGAEHYLNASAKLRELAQKRVKQPAGEPFTAVGADGRRVLVQRFSDGTAAPVTGFAPEAKTQVVDLGGSQAVVDLSRPGQSLTKTQTPDSAANLTQKQTEFSQMFPLEAKKVEAAATGARASMIGAGASAQNAGTSAARLAFDREFPAHAKLGEAAVNNIADMREGLRQLGSLSESVGKSGNWMGPAIGGVLSLPGATGAAQAMGYDEPAVLQARIGLARQIIGKALEGGVLRKEDEAKYAKILPTIRDTPSAAKAKLKMLQEELSRDLSVYVKTQQDYGRRAGVQPDSPPAAGPRIKITPVP